MVNLEELRTRGLRAYELARLRVASRVLLMLAPMSVVCWLITRQLEACACLAVALAAVAVWLRWRNGAGVRAVELGLRASFIPALVGFVIAACEPECGGALCLMISAAAGGIAGARIAGAMRHQNDSDAPWWAAALIAALATSLGCAALGVLGFAGIAVGVIVGRGAGALVLT